MKRRGFLRTAAMVSSTVVFDRTLLKASKIIPASTPAPGILDVGNAKQLFLDDMMIAERSRISNFMYRPDKHPHNPIIKADKPWEMESGVRDLRTQSVIYDAEEQCFKMWYSAANWESGLSPWCYAFSKNGYDWEKPDLGIYDYKTSRRNNILAAWDGENDVSFGSVHKTPDPNPQGRYKAMGEWENAPPANRNGGACIAFSPDGFHWTVKEKRAIRHGRNLGDGPSAFGWDPLKKKYVAYPRPGHGLGLEINGVGHHRHIRSIGYAESDDFLHWTPTEIMLAPDLEDRVDYQFGEFSAAICANIYVGFLMIHETHEQTWGVYLMSSRDGFHWNWVNRHTPFMVRGEPGSFDGGYQGMCPPVTHEGKTYIYYTGYSGIHGTEHPPAARWGKNRTSIALATMPEDRWLGLLAGPERGTIVTKPMVFKGSRLMVDIDASTPQSPPGPEPGFDECEVRLALTDQSGGRIEGFTADKSTRLLRSGRQEVSWEDADLRRLEGKPVRVRFEMRNAALYSFQFL